jgi:hypothetical protein
VPPPPSGRPDEAGACPRCGTPAAPGQEYCLECGLRLPAARGVVPTLGRAWRRRLPWYPGDWIWPALLGLVIAALGAAGAIASSDDDGAGGSETIVATTAPLTRAVTTTPRPPEPTTTVTATRTRRTVPRPGRTATRPGTTAKPKTTQAPRRQRPPAATLVAWPAGRSGYTVVLASLPVARGLDAARTKAREALRARMPQVGVLESSRFSSLHPGYYVVFAGIHETFAEAQRTLGRFPAAFRTGYVRQITP